MITDVEYLGSVGVGVTRPKVFRDQNGIKYIVKLQQNRLGPKVLVNELLAWQMGTKLELCFPPADLLYLPAGKWQGLHFACRLLSPVRYLNQHNLGEAENIKQLAGVMLFDHLFFNLDRTLNRKNLLLCNEQNKKKIYAIDHSHLFKKGRWSAESLKRLAEQIRVNNYRIYGILLKRYLSTADFAVYASKMQLLSDQEIKAMIQNIPEQWLPKTTERNALNDYIIIRRDMTELIVRKICELIPDHNRSTNSYIIK